MSGGACWIAAALPWGSLLARSSRRRECAARFAAMLAVVAWNWAISDPRYHDGIESEAWKVVVSEVVFEPDA